MLLNALPGLVVGRQPESSLPFFGSLMPKSGLLVKNGEILGRSEVFGVQLHGSFKFTDRFIDLALFPIEQSEMKVQTIGQWICVGSLLQVGNSVI